MLDAPIKFNRGIEKFGGRDAKWHPSNPSASKRPRCQFWRDLSPAAMWRVRVVLNFQGNAERLSQRLTKSQLRALNRSNTSTKRAQPHSADHQRDRPGTLNLIKRLTEIIEKWFDHHFSSFFQGYSLRHKKSVLILAVDQRTWRFFFRNFLRKSKLNLPRPENTKLKLWEVKAILSRSSKALSDTEKEF